MRFLLKYPTRSRPELFKERVRNWCDTSSGMHTLTWLVSADYDDETMNTFEIWEWCGVEGVNLIYGDNHSKVEACNADLQLAGSDWDVLVLVSDDMVAAPGWDQTIADNMPDDLNMGLWFPDGRQRRLCTLSIFGRPILDNVLGGFIYHPEFKSVWADNYYQWIMQQHGLLKFVDIQIARHAWQEQNRDALMQRNESRELYRLDRATFERLTREQHALAEPRG